MHPILALLVCGHVLADFLFQTDGMVERKQSSVRELMLHTLEVGLVQALVVLPFAPSLRGVALVAGIPVTHLLIDSLKLHLDRAHPARRLTWLLLDQAAHVGVLLIVWRLWPTLDASTSLASVGSIALVLAVFVFSVNGGSAIVSASLSDLDMAGEPDEGPEGVGKRIGVLERWIILGLVWFGQWGTVGLVLTAKSVARFKRMDEQRFAEVYLIGTMTSVLVAMVGGVVLRAWA